MSKRSYHGATSHSITDKDRPQLFISPQGRKEMFYLTTHSTHFNLRLYGIGHMITDHSDSERETCCRHMGYSFRLTARDLLYALSHRHDRTYHSLCYTSRGALAGTRNSSKGPPHEGSIRWPIAPWANTLTTELHLTPSALKVKMVISTSWCK